MARRINPQRPAKLRANGFGKRDARWGENKQQLCPRQPLRLVCAALITQRGLHSVFQFWREKREFKTKNENNFATTRNFKVKNQSVSIFSDFFWCSDLSNLVKRVQWLSVTELLFDSIFSFFKKKPLLWMKMLFHMKLPECAGRWNNTIVTSYRAINKHILKMRHLRTSVYIKA